MKHLARTVGIALAVIAAAVPTILADPDVRGIIASHPWLAAYVPVVSGIVYALYKAWQERPVRPAAATPAPKAPT